MVYSWDEQTLAVRVERVAEALKARGWSLVTAESCTGGWVAKVCTDRVGSSRWFERGFVTYSNEAKQEALGVEAALLAEHGAVSEAVARAMTAGALNHSRAEVALAITGIAGPGGGSADKPVGTVWFAWQRRGQPAEARRLLLEGDRNAVRGQAVAVALSGLLEGGGVP